MEGFVYDTVIIGGGPAGYTAALYCTRAGLSTLVLEKFSAGGQMTETQSIENYPGFDESVDGFTLGFKMQAGAEKYGARTVNAEVRAVFLTENPKRILTAKEEYLAKTVVIATGASHKHLGVAREEALIGGGIGYCAACDGMLYKGKTVAVVGGGNSAAADALYLSRICKKVYLIHRRDKLRAAKVHSDALGRTETVEFKWNTRVAALHGEDTLTSVTLESTAGGAPETLMLDGLFISIGRSPVTALFEGQLAMENGYIVAGEDTKTSVDGVFAAGDVRTKEVRQIVTAAADGAVCAHYIEEYLASEYGA
ncbi:MAG: thioredoxin-disulfide reductase [Clostridia bacterium]|nr:thioredoxin-disulfide reductase [Clostridia bacterium]